MQKKEYQSLLGKNNNNLYQVKVTGRQIEITYCDYRNTKQNIQKISNKEYINLIDGTINKFEKKDSRIDNIDSVKKTIKNLRDIINSNCEKSENILFVTLTYKENMTDRKRLMHDFEIFHKRWKRYHLKNYGYSPKYICVPEPQGRGAWHCHIIFIYPEKPHYIENKKVAEMWGNGFVNIKKCDDIDNIGAYLSSYLTNTPTKKGGRLHMYPVGMHMFRTSNDIKKPTIYYDSIENITKLLQNYDLTYWCSYEMENEKFSNRIEKRFYKKIINQN